MHLHLADTPRIELPGGDVRALAALDAALLAWLALEGPTPRARLATLLWPEKDAEAARNSLRQRLFQLNRRLGVEVVRGSTTLQLAEGIAHDLDDGDTVLGDAELAVDGEFAAWLEQQRSRRRDRMRNSLAELADMAEAAKDWADALVHVREMLALEPLSEAVHRRLMRLHYLAGDRAAALLAFDHCEQLLKDEVGTRPAAETLALLATIQRSAEPLPAVAREVPAGLLRPPRLVGRQRDLQALGDALAAGDVVAVLGEAGMGKSRLLDAWRSREPGWVYASARPGDASVPLASLSRLLREVAAFDTAQVQRLEPVHRRELARLLPEIDEVAPRPGLHRLELERAVRAFLTGRGVRGLLFDDLHLADPASIELLATVLSEPADAAAPAWVLAFRPGEAGAPLVALQDALVERLRWFALSLAPLDERGIADLIDSLELPGLRAEALAAPIHRRTGGSPMFVLETLKQAWLDGRLGPDVSASAWASPGSIGRLIERRLARLSAPALALARVASIAEGDFELVLAEQVLGQPAMQFADAIVELESAQVLRGRAFAHDLVYETVRAGVPAIVAARTHAQVAQWLAEHGGEPARLARHWIEAGTPARAIGPLREAARRSVARTALVEAQRFLEEAVRWAATLGMQEEEFEALDELSLLFTLDDPGEVYDAVVRRANDIAQGEHQRLRAAVMRCDWHNRRQNHLPPDEVMHWAEEARRLGDHKSLDDLLTIAIAAYVADDDPDGAVLALAKFPGAERVAAQRQLPLRADISFVLATQDRYAEAIEQLDLAMASFRQHGDLAEVMRMMCNRTRYYRMQGRLQTALAAYEDIDRWHASAAPNTRSWAMLRAPHAETLCDLGRHRDALREVEVELEVALRAAGTLGLAWPVARARIWLSLGQATRAIQALDAGEPMLEGAPAWLRARWQLLRAQTLAWTQGDGLVRPGREALRWLDEAERNAPREHRRHAWFDCELQRAAWSEGVDGAMRAELIASLAARQGMFGHAQHARYRAAERWCAAGRLEDARHALDQARRGSMQRFAEAGADEPVHPASLTAAEADWIEAVVAQACDQADAGDLARRAAQRVRDLAEREVPEAFRDGFLHRHPVHREVLALAARAPHGTLTPR